MYFNYDELYKSLKLAMDSIGKYREALPEMNKGLQDAMVDKAITSATSSVVKYFDFNKIMDGVSKTLEDTSHKFSKILLLYGWPPHQEMNINHMIEIIDLQGSSEIKKDSISELINSKFLSFYNEKRINKMLTSWSSKEWLSKRIPILRECVKAHINEMYFVSVPALLPQIEGIIADGYSHKGKMNGTDLSDYSKRLLNNANRFSYDSVIQDYFFQFVLATFEHGKTINSFLSRHAILHGGDCSYGTEVNSLKSLLLFDYFQDKFGFASLPNTRVYHKQGCGVITKFKASHSVDTLTIYNSVQQAEKDGKSHCGYCINESDRKLETLISVVTPNKTNGILNS
jgi:hypothetical protein